jgi:hypothetical protein
MRHIFDGWSRKALSLKRNRRVSWLVCSKNHTGIISCRKHFYKLLEDRFFPRWKWDLDRSDLIAIAQDCRWLKSSKRVCDRTKVYPLSWLLFKRIAIGSWKYWRCRINFRYAVSRAQNKNWEPSAWRPIVSIWPIRPISCYIWGRSAYFCDRFGNSTA